MTKAALLIAVFALGSYSWDELKDVLIMQSFAGVSLFSVFLLMALGLAIIFGQMKVINMAHGEFLTIGAYTTVVVSHLAEKLGPTMMAWYFPFALIAAFAIAFIVGYLIEWLIIRHLYHRPLDTLLATYGCSLIMQEIFRQTFGARETSATLPEWLMGSWTPVEGVDIPINGMVLLGVCAILTAGVYLMLYRSRWGLRMRATVLNRTMAGAVGINTKRTDRLTFALGLRHRGRRRRRIHHHRLDLADRRLALHRRHLPRRGLRRRGQPARHDPLGLRHRPDQVDHGVLPQRRTGQGLHPDRGDRDPDDPPPGPDRLEDPQ